MTMQSAWGVAGALCLAFASSAWAQALPPRVQMIANLPYGRFGESTALDLYLPINARKAVPLVIWIHGGGWESGAKDGWPALSLVDKGFAVATINYRLSDQAKFPAQIYDCKAAVRWLRANAKKYRLDPDHFGVWGGSAGGHLAALLGTSANQKDLEGPVGKGRVPSSEVQAVCDCFGPTDLVKFTEFQASFRGLGPDAPEKMVTKLLGGSVESKKDLAQQANPITFASDKCPPFLIMHGDRDNLVPLSQSRLLERALRDAGAKVELRVMNGIGHGIERAEDLYAVEQFFDKTLRPREDDNPRIAAENIPTLATFTHQAGNLAAKPISFYANGRIDSAESPNTWNVLGNALVLCWYSPKAPNGVYVDTCLLAPDGSAYAGANQDGARIAGTLASGSLLRRAGAKGKAKKAAK